MTALLDIFKAPLIVAAVSATGLVAALLGDGALDALSALAVALPLLVLAIVYGGHALRRRRPAQITPRAFQSSRSRVEWPSHSP